MRIISSSDLRKNLKQQMDEVRDRHEPLIVTSKNAVPVVMLSMDDYRALDETAYLLSTPANAKRLKESFREVRSGMGRRHTLAADA